MIKVLLVDDHQMFIDGLKSILQNEPEIEIIGEALDGDEVLKKLEEETIDVVVMDVEMPNLNGIETTKQIKKSHPKTKVLILTMYNRKRFIVELMNIGANGYILKNKSEKELVNAIFNVYKGNAHFGLEVLNQLQVNDNDEGSDNILPSQLSKREREVLCLIAKGMTSKEIVPELNISEATVNTHRRNLLEKLQVPNDKYLVRYAIRHNLIEPQRDLLFMVLRF